MDQRYRSSPLVDASEIDDRVILYHRTLRKAIVLNRTGTILWAFLATPRTEMELADRLVEHFPTLAPDALRVDTGSFVAHLLAEGLLDIAND